MGQPSLKIAVGGKIDADVPQAWVKCEMRSSAFTVVPGWCVQRSLRAGAADVAAGTSPMSSGRAWRAIGERAIADAIDRLVGSG